MPLNNRDVQKMLAGNFIVTADLNVEAVPVEISATMRFNEKSGIELIKSEEGFITQRSEIEKKNIGNVPAEVTIDVTKNILSRWYTFFNIPYNTKERKGWSMTYTFKKELNPADSLRVVTKTYLWVPFGLAIAVICISIIIYRSTKIVIKKRLSYVRTKGGEFALKVTLTVKARRFAENIKLVDRIPYMVKVFERFGAVAPDQIDEKNRRIEWNIQKLNKGEERIFSYIIYSKIGVVGRFELPEAEALFECEGKIGEATSNKAFYINEPRAREIPPSDF